jgi:hypothetical protein
MPMIKPTNEMSDELSVDELWTSISENRHARRVLYEHDGHVLSLGSWAQRLGLSKQAAQFRMKKYGTFVEGKVFKRVGGTGKPTG